MADPVIEIPLNEQQKALMNLAFVTLSAALGDTDNPFGKTVEDSLTKTELEEVHAIMKKCEVHVKGFGIPLMPVDFFPFYVSVHLVRHIFKSDYFFVFLERCGEDVAMEKKRMSNAKDFIYAIADRVLDSMSNLEEIPLFAEYLINADMFPDLMTGISAKLAAYNHIPNIPKNPPQLNFGDYNEEDAFTYDLRVNPLELLKDINCMGALLLIVGDAENPPAKILNAYFPNFENQIRALVRKFTTRDRRRRWLKLSDGDIGLLYACADLYGRLKASSYNKLGKKLEKGTEFEELSSTIEDIFTDEDNKSFLMSAVEISLKRDNESFGDYEVIKAYRKVAAEMISFDD